MAQWALWKLLHPFTPEDLLRSQRVVSSLKLPPATSQFVLALSDPRSPEKIVYVLSVEKLSERSIDDIHRLVAAVNPSSVVAYVDAQYLTEIVEEGKLLESPKGLEVPTSFVDVIRNCFVEKIKTGVYESRARLKVLINIFGTTFYGNVLAARKAAEKTEAVFEYLRIPSTVTSSFADDDDDDGEVHDEVEWNFEPKADSEQSSSRAGRFLTVFSSLLGGNDLEYTIAGVNQPVCWSPCSSFHSTELAPLASVAPSLPGTVINSSGLQASSFQNLPTADNKLREDLVDGCPSFAAPVYPLFVDLHQLFTETPGVNQALSFAKKVLHSVERGDGVDHEDLSHARLFRLAVESVRVCWNSFVRTERGVPSRLPEFSQLPFEEKCQSLLAHALRYQAEKFNTVVAIVDASSVPGIRRHWNTPVPPEVAAYAEYCFEALNFEEIGQTNKGIKQTKAAVVVGAGAVAAAGLGSLPHWASVPAFMKVFSVKIPTALKLVLVQMKRQAFVSWANPASQLVVKSSGFLSSSSVKAMLLNSLTGMTGADHKIKMAKMAAHTVVAAAEKASFQAIRTAFYSLMRNRQANKLGPRPWLVLGGSLAAAGSVLFYGDGVEHAISVVPSAPAVVRLGRGLENLEQASGRVADYEGSRWWNRVYETLYRNPHRF